MDLRASCKWKVDRRIMSVDTSYMTKECELQLLFTSSNCSCWSDVSVFWNLKLNWCHSKSMKNAQSTQSLTERKATTLLEKCMIKAASSLHMYCLKCVFTTANRKCTIGVQFMSSFLELPPFSSILSGKMFSGKLQIKTKTNIINRRLTTNF